MQILFGDMSESIEIENYKKKSHPKKMSMKL